MKCITDVASCGMKYIQSFMETGTGVQATLQFSLINLRGCNVGITEGRDLRTTPLRWAQVQ
jgi:hypothetical protein